MQIRRCHICSAETLGHCLFHSQSKINMKMDKNVISGQFTIVVKASFAI